MPRHPRAPNHGASPPSQLAPCPCLVPPKYRPAPIRNRAHAVARVGRESTPLGGPASGGRAFASSRDFLLHDSSVLPDTSTTSRTVARSHTPAGAEALRRRATTAVPFRRARHATYHPELLGRYWPQRGPHHRAHTWSHANSTAEDDMTARPRTVQKACLSPVPTMRAHQQPLAVSCRFPNLPSTSFDYGYLGPHNRVFSCDHSILIRVKRDKQRRQHSQNIQVVNHGSTIAATGITYSPIYQNTPRSAAPTLLPASKRAATRSVPDESQTTIRPCPHMTSAS